MKRKWFVNSYISVVLLRLCKSMMPLILKILLLMTTAILAWDIEVYQSKTVFIKDVERVVVPLQITGAYIDPDISSYTVTTQFTNSLGEVQSWLYSNQTPPYNSTYDETHFLNLQGFWLELNGVPTKTGSYSGTVRVCKTDVDCREKSFSFSVVDNSTQGLLLTYSDPSANYGAQLEIRTQLLNTSSEPIELISPYYDYYLTSTDELKVYSWGGVSVGCIEVYKCTEGGKIIRHRLNASVISANGVKQGPQSGYMKSNYQTLEEKVDQPSSEFDFSYPYISANSYERAGYARNYLVNPKMALYSNNQQIWGEPPPAWVSTCQLANAEFFGGIESNPFCVSNTSPTFITPNNQSDILYSGEDYAFFPEVSDADGDVVTFRLVGAPTWLEVGTPSDFQPGNDWPHQGTAYSSRQYIRTKYQSIRQQSFLEPGTYAFDIVADDGKGGSSTIRRTIIIRHPMNHPIASARGNKVAMLVGDETWFRNQQLDIATGIAYFDQSGSDLVNPYYDYYITWTESNMPFLSSWYSNPGWTVDLKQCKDQHWRVRYKYSGILNPYYNHSLFDNKAGLFQTGWSNFNKVDDYSFKETPDNSKLMVRRHYDPNVVLYNGDHNILWGEPPYWAGECPDNASSSSSGTSSSSSSNIITSSSSSLPSLFNWKDPLKKGYPQVYYQDMAISDVRVFKPNFQLTNTGNADLNIGGYRVRYYIQGSSSYDLKKVTLNLYDPAGSLSSKFVEQCGESQYALTLIVPPNTNLPLNGKYPSRPMQMEIQPIDWGNNPVFPKVGGSFVNDGTVWKINPAIAVFDGNDNWVSGDVAWECKGYASQVPKVEVYVRDEGTYYVPAKSPKVELLLKNVGEKLLEPGTKVSFYFKMPNGTYPRLANKSQEKVTLHNTTAGSYSVEWVLSDYLANGSQRSVKFELSDQCEEECVANGDVWDFPWDKSDDYSLLVKSSASTQYVSVGSQFTLTDRILVRDALGSVIYGSADGNSDMAVSISDNQPALVHLFADVPQQVANKTSAVQYALGSVLVNGTFEKGALGWDVSENSKSVLAQMDIPEGARYLTVTSFVRQSFTSAHPAYRSLALNGARLSVWLKGSGNVTLRLGSVSTVKTLGKSWSRYELSVPASALQSLQATLQDMVLEITGTNFDIDNAVLQPGTVLGSVNHAVRYTSTQHVELETQIYDGTSMVWVSQSDRDVLGRPWRKALPFGLTCEGVACNRQKTEEGSITANSYYNGNNGYPQANGYAYSETQYEADQVATVSEVGLPGALHIGGGHVAKTYYSGINLEGVNLLDIDAVRAAVGTDLRKPVAFATPTHAYEATIDVDGRQAFQISDLEKHVVASGSYVNGRLALSVNEYDDRGLLSKSHSPASCEYVGNSGAECVSPTEFIYNDEGKLIRKVESDAGTTRIYYDVAGRQRATQSQRQADVDSLTLIGLDDFDRVTYSAKCHYDQGEGSLRRYLIEHLDIEHCGSDCGWLETCQMTTMNLYDTMPGEDWMNAYGVRLYPVGMTVADFPYGKDRLNASISWGTPIEGITDNNGRQSVFATSYQYGKYGQVFKSYSYNGLIQDASLRLTEVRNTYDAGLRLLSTLRMPRGESTPATEKTGESYEYDALGRIAQIKNLSGGILAKYEYNPAGNASRVWLANNTLRMDLEYHISGALKRTRTQKVDNGTVLYDEILYYEDCVDRSDCIPQYGGNIARMAQWLNHSNPLKGKQRDAAYTYDELSRLTIVNEQLQNDFDEEISYDTQGRIRSMQRGIAVLGNGGQYTYKGNQLQNISAGMDAGNERNRQGTSTNPNYQYDSDGNRIADHSQNHVTTYNADGMAEREELLQDGNEWRVEHRYTVGSQRTAKMVFRKVDGSWQYQNGTFYTGLGMEVRENATGEGRVITQLPNGLGRYAQGSASDVEWNIKNHLGSTMLVWGQGSAKSAYDYWSFGKRMALTLASEKVTEEFTGKELDEETGLNYFGARYYDSDIGGWVSVDPMRQFASPYLYAGNWANPVNGVDPDGKTWGETIGMFWDWLLGLGDKHSNYNSSTNQTIDMMNAPQVNAARKYFTQKNFKYFNEGKPLEPLTNFRGSFGLSELLKAGLDPTEQFVGSFSVNIYPNEDGQTATFVLENVTSMESFLYGLAPSWDRKTFNPGGNMSQTYWWVEQLPEILKRESTDYIDD